MLLRGQHLAFQWPSRSRLPWLALALALMFVSAYSVFGLMGAVARISGWTGLPQYEAEIPKIRAEARWWETLAIVMPLLAALVLGFGKKSSVGSPGSESTTPLTYPAESQAEEWTAPIVRYFTRLGVSLLGTFGFLLCLFLLGFLLYKLGVRAS